MSAVSPDDWRCPICSKPVAAGSAQFPFCSDRCRLVDLGRWLDGTYLERARDRLEPAADDDSLDHAEE